MRAKRMKDNISKNDDTNFCFSCRTSEKTWRQKCFLRKWLFQSLTFLLPLTLFKPRSSRSEQNVPFEPKLRLNSEKNQTLSEWHSFTFSSLTCLVFVFQALKESGGKPFSQCRKAGYPTESWFVPTAVCSKHRGQKVKDNRLSAHLAFFAFVCGKTRSDYLKERC